MKTGVLKATTLTVTEIHVNLADVTVSFEAHVAFVDTKTSRLHSWSKNRQWTPATMRKLEELRAAMEDDLARIHFGEDTNLPVEQQSTPAGKKPEGLLAHLNAAEDADPV